MMKWLSIFFHLACHKGLLCIVPIWFESEMTAPQCLSAYTLSNHRMVYICKAIKEDKMPMGDFTTLCTFKQYLTPTILKPNNVKKGGNTANLERKQQFVGPGTFNFFCNLILQVPHIINTSPTTVQHSDLCVCLIPQSNKFEMITHNTQTS